MEDHAAQVQSLKYNRALELLTPTKKQNGHVPGFWRHILYICQLSPSAHCVFFNWLNCLTDTQSASIVRSFTGLLCHLSGRIAAALANLLLNSRIALYIISSPQRFVNIGCASRQVGRSRYFPCPKGKPDKPSAANGRLRPNYNSSAVFSTRGTVINQSSSIV